VRITGIGTEVDDLCRVLVAASAIIPVFGFPDWDYARLGEVLIYPQAFGEDYHAAHEGGPVILGMVGAGHLHGVMVLSKPDLIAGFDNPGDKHNVGIHEFAHLVDEADGAIDGLPPGVPPVLARSWVAFVARQLQHPPKGRSHINRYGYTNQAELFAVLAEYFFKSPEVLARKDAKLYDMLRQMFHQDTRTLLSHALPAPRRRLGRNSPCPCGSGKKYKHCCLAAARTAPAA
jgi:Mlc titration factor MtfA (ptsG expression regulator)